MKNIENTDKVAALLAQPIIEKYIERSTKNLKEHEDINVYETCNLAGRIFLNIKEFLEK